MKDKSYRAFPLGLEAGHYLRAKRKRLTDDSYRDYDKADPEVSASGFCFKRPFDRRLSLRGYFIF